MVITIAIGAIVLGIAWFGGSVLGRALRSHARALYIGATAAVLTLALALVFAAYLPQIAPTTAISEALTGIGLGLGFGGMAGIRRGYAGLSVGKSGSGMHVTEAPSSAAPAGPDTESGFTLVETLVAAAILVVVSTAILTVIFATSSWYRNARLRTESFTVANRVMTLILARNSDEIRRPTGGETWPVAVPATMEWASSVGTMTVETSLVRQVDPATSLDTTLVIVSAYPIGQVLNPPVAVRGLVSNWQNRTPPPGGDHTVDVEVQLQEDPGSGVLADLGAAGARVQLLDVTNLDEAYYGITNQNGVALITGVTQGRYFLTVDYRFGTNVRPVHFPEKIYPSDTSGGAGGSTMHYTVEVAQRSASAILSVGAYRNVGWHNPIQLSPGLWSWSIDKPYEPVSGLRIWARPVLNVSGTQSSIPGAGSTYPEEALYGDGWSALVNAYGIARIEIPYTVDPSLGQYWEVACVSANPSDGSRTFQLNDTASGGWDTPINKPDNLDQGLLSAVPQFYDMLNETPVNTDPWP